MTVTFKEIALTEVENCIHMRITGKLSVEDYDFFVPEFDQRIETYGKINILIELVDFHGWTVGAAWEDTKFGIRHFADINRIAIVGDKAWEEGMSYFLKVFTLAKVQYFDRSQLNEALTWINEGN